jgi:ABC-type uncharacterized transport system permease subunit
VFTARYALSPYIKQIRFFFTGLIPVFYITVTSTLIPVAAQSKAWVCSHSLAGVVGSNPAGGMDVCLL